MSPDLRAGEAALPGARRPISGQPGADCGVIGFIDRVQGHRVSGWAIDRSRPEFPVEVRVFVDGHEAALVQADRYRHDLERGGLNGHHAFEATLEMMIEESQAHRVEVFAQSADGTPVALVNRPASLPRPSPADPRPAPESQQVLVELRALRERIEVLAGIDPASPRVPMAGAEDSLAMLADLGNQLPNRIERLDAFDLVQARIDAAIGRLEDRLPAQPRGRPTDRGLRIVVGLLAILSLVSLILGLRSLVT